MAGHIRMSIHLPQFVVEDRTSYPTGTSVRSPLFGPSDSFRCRFLVFPNGTRSVHQEQSQRSQTQGESLFSAFVELVPPAHMTEKWSCASVRYGITILSQKTGTEPIKKFDTFTFSNEHADRGWHDLFANIRNYSQYLGRGGEIALQGEVHIPMREQQRASAWQESFRQLDFTDDAKFLTFRLAEDHKLLFDQRLLTARSDYFRKMLSSTEWEESRTGEIDLTGEARATPKVMSAILRFILTNSFDAEDLETCMTVRELADRFCISALVEKVDAELLGILTDENILQILGRTLDTGSEVEATCWKMLETDGNILVKQAHKLETVIAENPALARKLILFGRDSKAREAAT